MLGTNTNISNIAYSFSGHILGPSPKGTYVYVRTDNAKELTTGDALQFCLKHGIQQQSSCTDTPQKNGMVKRKHKHILEIARSLLFQANLPISFWGDCTQCSVHLINKMPLSVLGGLTPYENYFGKKPDYLHLKVFGCLCYVSTLKKERHKFMP